MSAEEAAFMNRRSPPVPSSRREQQVIEYVYRMREPDVVRPHEEDALRHMIRLAEAEASTGAALDVERLGFYDLLDVAEAILTKYPPSRLLCDHASPDLGPRTTAAVADLIRSARLAEEGERS